MKTSLNKRISIVAGSFDPLTVGHYDIIERACSLFDKVIVAVANDAGGKNALSGKQRLQLARAALARLSDKIHIELFEGLLVDFVAKVGGGTLVRGLRNSIDFEYEKSLSAIYHSHNPDIEIMYLMSPPTLSHVSSSIIKEILRYGGSIRGYVPKNIEDKVVDLYS